MELRNPSSLTVISWGSTKGAILDAMDKLIEEEKEDRDLSNFAYCIHSHLDCAP